jgi:hypothetical protein
VHFFTRRLNLNPTRTELGLGAGFIFHPWVHLKPEKNPKPEKNMKNSKKTNLQNSTGTRPETRQVQVPNFTRGFRCQIQHDYIFSRGGF